MADAPTVVPVAAAPAVSGYSRKISVKKGGAGAIDGTIAAIITALIISAAKHGPVALPEGAEGYIAAVVGLAVSAVVIAAKRYVGNWMKNKNIQMPPVLKA